MATAEVLIQAATGEQSGILSGIVRRHLRASGNDRDAAQRASVAEILADDDTLNDVLHEVVSEAVDRYVRLDLKGQRDRAVSVALDVTRDAKARASGTLASLLDFPLRSGAKLHAATKGEVEETAGFYLASGATHVQRGLWLQAVSKKLPDAETPVGRVLDTKALTDLFNAAVKRVQKMGLPYGR